MTLKKHINIKHQEISYSETFTSYIFCLKLEKFTEEYRKYFKRYGFNRGEACHVEKIIKLHGSEYHLQAVE